MATDPDRLAEWASITASATDLPAWSSPADLARISMHAAWEQDFSARTVTSEGELHLGGAQTTDHTVRIGSLGNLLSAFQNLVTANGAAIEGIRSKTGQLKADLVMRTLLRQTQPIGVGSVTVKFAPEASPVDELIGSKGVALFDQPVEQFVDRCVRDALTLLQQAHDLGPDADESPFLAMITEGGPRLATALRNFAHTVTQTDFDVETSWTLPAKGTLHARFTPTDAKQVEQIIKARTLDEEPVELEGRIFASSLQQKWQLDLGEPGVVSIDMSKLPSPLNYADYPLTQRVRATARPQVREFPGGAVTTTYIVDDIARLDDEPE